MPPSRLAVQRQRDFDVSNVGVVGRRTGTTLALRPLDENGMEEVTGIFSSPRKPSPLKQMVLRESLIEQDSTTTPIQVLSPRKTPRPGSVPPPRSASPRKSGISGTARRSNVVDVLGLQKEKEVEIQQDQENRPPSTPVELSELPPASVRVATAPKRSSPEKTPLRDHILGRRSNSVQTRRRSLLLSDAAAAPEEDSPSIQIPQDEAEETIQSIEVSADSPYIGEDDHVPAAPEPDDDHVSAVSQEDETELPPAAPIESDDEEIQTEAPVRVDFDDEEADQTFEPQSRARSRNREPTKANSRRKRKSDATDIVTDNDVVSSPAAKRAKRRSDEGLDTHFQQTKQIQENQPASDPPTHSEPKERKALAKKSANPKLPSRQEKELDQIIEKVKARPGPPRSLYILRRETPADEGVTHTRSGRISVKPLAYWRNERCVYGGSPGNANLRDGARFPLNSIKEIIRTEEVNNQPANKSKSRNGKGKGRGRTKGSEKASAAGRSGSASTPDAETEMEPEEDSGADDNEAEPWETEKGIYRGLVSVWDPEQQAPVEEEEEMEIAYAEGAIQTKEVKDSTFRYAKLLNSKFFGSGIVELPAGGVKKPKNSRRMHMCFFVTCGRVTVSVGPLNGPESRFSVGKGGFWQVPRGNQYSIENERSQTAKIFFSQASEPAPQEFD